MANPWLASVGLQPGGVVNPGQGGGEAIAAGIAQAASGIAQGFAPQAERQQRTAVIAAANQLDAKAQDLQEQQLKAGTYDPDQFKAQFEAYAKPFRDKFASSQYGQVVENAASAAALQGHAKLFGLKLDQDNKQEAGTLLQHQDVLSGQVRDGLAAGMSYDDPRLADARAMSAAHDRRLAQLGYSPSDLQGKALQREGQWRGVQLVTQAQQLLRAKGDRAGPAAAEQAIDDFRLHGPSDVPPDVRDLAAAHAKSLLQGDIGAAATRYAAAEKAQGEARQVAAYKAMDTVGAMVARGDDPSSYLASQKAALGPVGYAAAQVHLHGELRQQAQAKTQADLGLAMTLDPLHAEDAVRARAQELGPVEGPRFLAEAHVRQAQAAGQALQANRAELKAQIETHLDTVSQNDLDNWHADGKLDPATWAELTKAKAAATSAIAPDLGLSFAPQPAPSSPDAVVPAADPAGKVPDNYNQDHNSPSALPSEARTDDRRQAIQSARARAPSQGDGDGADDEDLPDQKADAGQGGAPSSLRSEAPAAAAAAQNRTADARAQAGNAPAAAQAQAPNAVSVWLAAASGQRLPATPENAKRLDALIAAVNKGQAGGPPLNPNTPDGRANLARLVLATGVMPPSVASLLKGAVNSQDERTLDAALDFYQRLRGGLRVEDGAKADDPSAGLRVLAGAVDDKTQAFYGRLGTLRGATQGGIGEFAQNLREDIFGSADDTKRRMLERLGPSDETSFYDSLALEMSTKLGLTLGDHIAEGLPFGLGDVAPFKGLRSPATTLSADALPAELKRVGWELNKQMLVKYSGNKDLAVQDAADQLLDVWGMSRFSGDGTRLVKHPPEGVGTKGPGVATMPGDNHVGDQLVDFLKAALPQDKVKFDPNVDFSAGGMRLGGPVTVTPVQLPQPLHDLAAANPALDAIEHVATGTKQAVSDVAGAIGARAERLANFATDQAYGHRGAPRDLGELVAGGYANLHPYQDGKRHGQGDPLNSQPAYEVWIRHNLDDPSDLGQLVTKPDGSPLLYRPNPNDTNSPIVQNWLLAKKNVDEFAQAHHLPFLATQTAYNFEFTRLNSIDPRIEYSRHAPVGTFPAAWRSLEDMLGATRAPAPNVRSSQQAPDELPPPEE